MNKTTAFLGMMLAWGSLALTAQAQVQVGVGVNAGGGGDSFHLAIGDYYHAPEADISFAAQRHIPDEEMPVVFFLAARAHVAPRYIINLRAHGLPWFEIIHRYHLNPRIFYVPLHGAVVGTPYERFYSYYGGRPGVRLVDADFVNMVNLRFATEYYHRTPEEVIRLRAGGRSFGYIHDQYHGHPDDHGRRDDHRDYHDDHRGY